MIRLFDGWDDQAPARKRGGRRGRLPAESPRLSDVPAGRIAVVKLAYDTSARALYITLTEGRGTGTHTVAIDGSTNVDLDAAGNLLGIEVLTPGCLWPLPQILRNYEVSDDDARMLMACYPNAITMSAT